MGTDTGYDEAGRWGDTGEYDDMPSWYLAAVLCLGILAVLLAEVRDSAAAVSTRRSRRG